MENMESSCVPPGFRFRPTEEQLVGYYLKRKVNALTIDLNVIVEVDLYRIEPWDIQDRCKLGYELEQNEWYFFSHKDRKYPTGTRTNRATAAGFWKATGRDKAVLSKERLIGMRKTLVFYKGRAPNGRKTDWIMHEYRIQTSEHGPTQEEGWVVCRAFKKPCPSHRQGLEAWNNTYYLMNRSESSTNIDHSRPSMSSYPSTILDNLDHLLNQGTNSDLNQSPFPKLDSPSISTSFTTNENINLQHSGLAIEDMSTEDDQQKISCVGNDLYTYSEWKNFDKLLELESQPSMGTSSSYAYTALLRHDDE